MKKKVFAILFLSGFIALSSFSQAKHSFEIRDGQFFYDSKPILVHAGEMHYARVPDAYWRHRIRTMKAMGLNTIATYIFWNFHNTAPGVWDFKTGSHDLRRFLKIAQDEGMLVLLRPGPYVCAEWEFGGFPWWLSKNKDLVVRSYNQPFLDSCKIYYSRLYDQVKDFLVTRGGPVVMVQVENEFGSYVEQATNITPDNHRRYNEAILQMVKAAGFDVPLYTADGAWAFKGGALPGVLPSANGEGNITNLKKMVNEYHGGKGPYMIGEYYPGWLDHWNDKFARVATADVVKQVKQYLDSNVSFSFYMIHGGTNFGFMAGANYDAKHDIQPDLTSYDYDAPISEAGWATDKYMALRDLFQKYTDKPLPQVPSPLPVIAVQDIPLKYFSDGLDLAKKAQPVTSIKPLSFEDLNQGYGYVLYSAKVDKAIKGLLQVKGLRDFATVYVNGKKVAVLDRSQNKFESPVEVPAGATLDILVENMGRINYGERITESERGILSDVTINSEIITGWKMYGLPFDVPPPAMTDVAKGSTGRAAVYKGIFTLNATGDTFIDMSDWEKGIVFVNGHHLGRFWNEGPQQTLYLPGCWLKKGQNEILVFDQLNDRLHSTISTQKAPVLDVWRAQ